MGADSRSNATSEAVLRSMDGMAPRPLVVAPHRLPSRPPRVRKRRTSTITVRRPRFCFSLSRPRPKKEIPPLNEIKKKKKKKKKIPPPKEKKKKKKKKKKS